VLSAKEGTMEVTAAWADIEEWLTANAPKVKKSLRPPADDAKLANLQKKLKLTLPADFVASVRVHDGQRSDDGCALIPGPPHPLGLGWYELLPLTDIRREWSMMKGLDDIGEFEGRKPRATRGIQPVWWSQEWVPIADNGGGDYVCLDLAPAKGGTVGQVILFGHEGTPQRRVARSFAEWLGNLAREFKAGKYALDEEEGLIEARFARGR
jgi:cell wall assembly regulator SMI1